MMPPLLHEAAVAEWRPRRFFQLSQSFCALYSQAIVLMRCVATHARVRAHALRLGRRRPPDLGAPLIRCPPAPFAPLPFPPRLSSFRSMATFKGILMLPFTLVVYIIAVFVLNIVHAVPTMDYAFAALRFTRSLGPNLKMQLAVFLPIGYLLFFVFSCAWTGSGSVGRGATAPLRRSLLASRTPPPTLSMTCSLSLTPLSCAPSPPRSSAHHRLLSVHDAGVPDVDSAQRRPRQ